MSTNANYQEIFAEFVEGVKESEAKAPMQWVSRESKEAVRRWAWNFGTRRQIIAIYVQQEAQFLKAQRFKPPRLTE
jgi:hypothetical protein